MLAARSVPSGASVLAALVSRGGVSLRAVSLLGTIPPLGMIPRLGAASLLSAILLLGGCDCSGAPAGAGDFTRCAAADPRLTEPVTVGALELVPDGRRLVLRGLEGESRWVVGRGPALSIEPIPPMLDAIESLDPHVVVVLGSLGTGARLEELVRALAELTVPTLLVPGPRDHLEELTAALEAHGSDATHLISLAGVQVVEAGPVELVIAPGAIDPRYVPDDLGCGLTTGDLEDALGAASEERLRVLVGFAAPAGTPLTSGLDGAEAGSELVRSAMTEAGVEAGIFAGPDTRVGEPFDGEHASPGPSRAFRLIVPALTGPSVESASGARTPSVPTLLVVGPEGLRSLP